jgi:uncharacterized protein (DUF58 family)
MRSVRPTARMLWLFAPGVALAGVAAWWPALLAGVVVWNALVLVAFALDERAVRRNGLRVARELPEIVMRGKSFQARFTLENGSARPLAISVDDGYPHGIEPRDVAFEERLPAGATMVRSIALKGLRRGGHPLSPPTVTCVGPLGLARATSEGEGAVKSLSVIADVTALGR